STGCRGSKPVLAAFSLIGNSRTTCAGGSSSLISRIRTSSVWYGIFLSFGPLARLLTFASLCNFTSPAKASSLSLAKGEGEGEGRGVAYHLHLAPAPHHFSSAAGARSGLNAAAPRKYIWQTSACVRSVFTW